MSTRSISRVGTRRASGARPSRARPFAERREARLPNPQTLDREGLVAYFASMSWIADLPDADRLDLLDNVRSLLGDHEYRREWETQVYWTRLWQPILPRQRQHLIGGAFE